MIKNDNQLTAARQKLDALQEASNEALGLEADVLAELSRELREQIAEFIAIRSGVVTAFNFQSLDELGEIACKVRVGQGITQRALAKRLGFSEQMVQRDEANSYEGSGLARVAETFDALGYLVRGSVCPVSAEPAYFNFRLNEPIDQFSHPKSTAHRTALRELIVSPSTFKEYQPARPEPSSETNRTDARKEVPA